MIWVDKAYWVDSILPLLLKTVEAISVYWTMHQSRPEKAIAARP